MKAVLQDTVNHLRDAAAAEKCWVCGCFRSSLGAMEVLEVAFFLIAILLCPVAFLVGTVGAIVIIVRRSGAAATAA